MTPAASPSCVIILTARCPAQGQSSSLLPQPVRAPTSRLSMPSLGAWLLTMPQSWAHRRRAGKGRLPLLTSKHPRGEEIRKMPTRLLACTLLLALMVVVPSAWADMLPQPADDEPSDVATVWFDTLYDVVK